jgi:hypothetical protein
MSGITLLTMGPLFLDIILYIIIMLISKNNGSVVSSVISDIYIF